MSYRGWSREVNYTDTDRQIFIIYVKCIHKIVIEYSQIYTPYYMILQIVKPETGIFETSRIILFLWSIYWEKYLYNRAQYIPLTLPVPCIWNSNNTPKCPTCYPTWNSVVLVSMVLLSIYLEKYLYYRANYIHLTLPVPCLWNLF